MGHRPMVIDVLPVIGGDDQQHIIEETSLSQQVENLVQHGIQVRKLIVFLISSFENQIYYLFSRYSQIFFMI